jgi:hypothetical protein
MQNNSLEQIDQLLDIVVKVVELITIIVKLRKEKKE